MPSYRYTARDERGNPVTGTLAAPTPEALADQLKRMGYLVTRSHELSDGLALETAVERWRRVSYDDLVMFIVQLSRMIQVGIPLVTALVTLTQQTPNAKLRSAAGDVARNVEGGESLSQALGRHPSVFSELFINMVHAGEVSGKLDQILRRLAVFTKRQAELQEQIKTALAYPAVLAVVGTGVITLLLTGIIPKFIKIFTEANVPLPLPTRLLYILSQVIRHYGLVAAGLAAMAIAALRAYARTPAGRRQMDVFVLGLPVIGDLARKSAIARLSRTLETLLSSGVPVLESLSIAERTCGNAVIADVCRTVQASVRQGGGIAEPLRLSGEFPPMVVQMIAVGESSGTVDDMLTEVGDYYDEMVRHSLKRLTTLIEPFFLIVMGGLVAFIMASVLMPLFRMVNVIH